MLHTFKAFGMKPFWTSRAKLCFATTQYLFWYVCCFIRCPYLHTSRSGNGLMIGEVTLFHAHRKLSNLFLVATRTLPLQLAKLPTWSQGENQCPWWSHSCCPKNLSVHVGIYCGWSRWSSKSFLKVSIGYYDTNYVRCWRVHSSMNASLIHLPFTLR